MVAEYPIKLSFNFLLVNNKIANNVFGSSSPYPIL